MPRVSFVSLPPTARLWAFAADRPLSSDARDRLLTELDRFLDVWAAHNVPLPAARELRYDRFLLIGVDQSTTSASGCSIDALHREVKRLERDYGVTLLDAGPVVYRDGDAIARVPRAEFQSLVDEGRVTRDTIVFDNTVTSVGALNDGRWEAAASETWHGRAFF